MAAMQMLWGSTTNQAPSQPRENADENQEVIKVCSIHFGLFLIISSSHNNHLLVDART